MRTACHRDNRPIVRPCKVAAYSATGTTAAATISPNIDAYGTFSPSRDTYPPNYNPQKLRAIARHQHATHRLTTVKLMFGNPSLFRCPRVRKRAILYSYGWFRSGWFRSTNQDGELLASSYPDWSTKDTSY